MGDLQPTIITVRDDPGGYYPVLRRRAPERMGAAPASRYHVGRQDGAGRMPTNPWMAIDATPTASPLRRARELRQIWYDYLSHGRIDRVRLPIAESWSRSEVAGSGVSPTRASS
jgi:hypothetical protein